MISRFRLLVGAVFILLLVVVWPVSAGGWAVVTLDALPTGVAAGEPFTIGFVVRQHGQHPTEGLTPTITAVHVETGESLTVPAEAEGAAGHYAATILLPSAGKWTWQIIAFGFDQPMPEIDVQGATVSASSPGTSRALPALAVLGWVAAAGFFLYGWRAKSRAAVALGLVTAVIGFAITFFPTAPSTETAVAQTASQTLSLIEHGEALFVAKGCVMCHVNERSIDLYAPHIGPNLTHYEGDPEFLRTWLADPPAMTAATRMPNLQLSDAEIEALITFLTVETAVSATN